MLFHKKINCGLSLNTSPGNVIQSTQHLCYTGGNVLNLINIDMKNSIKRTLLSCTVRASTQCTWQRQEDYENKHLCVATARFVFSVYCLKMADISC